jgi:hypothetical protein
MKVLFLNNEGAGFADYVQTEPGTTIARFLAAHLPHTRPMTCWCGSTASRCPPTTSCRMAIA